MTNKSAHDELKEWVESFRTDSHIDSDLIRRALAENLELQHERDVLQRELTRWQTAFAMFKGGPEELASWAVRDAAENKELKKERDDLHERHLNAVIEGASLKSQLAKAQRCCEVLRRDPSGEPDIQEAVIKKLNLVPAENFVGKDDVRVLREALEGVMRHAFDPNRPEPRWVGPLVKVKQALDLCNKLEGK